MSVINTNITSLIAQQNLGKSQNSLSTAMERLSSGMRINSAKDDAAGQAIANRMSAQITGLSQAQRNANDGISVAQTAEGALNQINDNLQRVRELTVQGQNDTNSEADLTSIQDEITQRLNEINRISEETDFNGTKVLSEDVAFQIQVGANDGETISVNLQEITSSTLGVGNFSVEDMRFSTDLSAALTSVAIDDVESTLTLSAATNSFTVGTTPVSSNIEAGDFYESAAGTLVTLASDGNYYAVSENTVTGQYSFDSSVDSGITASDVGDALANLEVAVATDPANAGTVAGQSVTDFAALTVTTQEGTDVADFFGNAAADVIGNIYERTDVEGEYAIKGTDGNYYAIEVSGDDTEFGIEIVGTDLSTPTSWTQVSAYNVAATAATEIVTGTEALPTGGDLLNQDIANTTNAPTDDGIYAISDPASYGGAEYAVLGSDGQYYTGSLDPDTGDVSWNSSGTGSIVDSADIGDEITAPVTLDVQQSVTLTGATAATAGLGAGETLHTDGDGNYVVQGQDSSGNTTFNQATVNDNEDGTVTITKGDPLTVDALATLDNALSKVDQLRSDLGAVQNRFNDAINNLATNETNLAAARSRIEDTDYALEVANMTRAQILQQAGTSVLAQANQLPQNVLSLLG